MDDRLIHLNALIVIGLFTSLACGGPAAVDQRDRPEALIVLEGATAIRDTDENEGTVVYEFDEEYPAGRVIQTISDRLESGGWRARREDFLNSLPTSQVEGGLATETAGQVARLNSIAGWGGERVPVE